MSLKEGWLSKRGAINTSWKKRYVVVTDTGLLYYRKPETKPLGAIPLSSVVVSTSDSPRDFNLYTTKRVYVFQAGDEDQRNEWVSVIHQVIPPLRLVPPDSLSLRPSPTRPPASLPLSPSETLSSSSSSSSSPEKENDKDKERNKDRAGSSPTDKGGVMGPILSSSSSPSISRDRDRERDRVPLLTDLREGAKSPRTSDGKEMREKERDRDREKEWEREEDYKEMAIRLQRVQDDLTSSLSREQALSHQLSLLQTSYDSLLASSLLKDQELSSLKEHKTVWRAETEALEEKLQIRDNMIKTLREEAEAKSKLLMQQKHSRLSVSPHHSLPCPDSSPSDPSEADKVEKLSRELDKAKEASMANSSHIVFLSGEIQRLEKDNQVLQRLLGTSEDPATKRLVEAEARERQLRQQIDHDSSRFSSSLKDLSDHLSFLKDRYFRSFVVAYKLKAQLGGKTSSVKVADLQERASQENVDFHNYEDWIKAQLDPTFV